MGAEIVAAAPPPLSLKCPWGGVVKNPSAKFGLIRALIRLITGNRDDNSMDLSSSLWRRIFQMLLVPMVLQLPLKPSAEQSNDTSK